MNRMPEHLYVQYILSLVIDSHVYILVTPEPITPDNNGYNGHHDYPEDTGKLDESRDEKIEYKEIIKENEVPSEEKEMMKDIEVNIEHNNNNNNNDIYKHDSGSPLIKLFSERLLRLSHSLLDVGPNISIF